MARNKWLIVHGKCIVGIICFLLVAAPFVIIKYLEVKKNYTSLHRRVRYIELKLGIK